MVRSRTANGHPTSRNEEPQDSDRWAAKACWWFVLVVGVGCLLVLATPAMAADNVHDVEMDPDEAATGESRTHSMDFTATGINETATVTVEFSPVYGADGDGSVGTVRADDVTIVGGDLDGDPTVDDGSVTFDVDVNGSAESVDVTMNVVLTHPWAAGEHDVTVAVDSGDGQTASDGRTSVTVETADLGGSFGQETYETPAGDLVEISADLGAADVGYVIVGGDYQSDTGAASGSLDVLYVEGDPTITVNTRLIGTNASTEDVYDSDGTVISYAHEYGPDEHAADTTTFDGLRFEDADGNSVGNSLSDLRRAAGAGGIAGPLIPQRYRITIGTGNAIVVRDDGVVEPERSFARSHLILTEPTARESVALYTAPSGPANNEDSLDELLAEGTAIPSSNVTEGDRLVLGFEATGIWGALTHLANEDSDVENGQAAIYEDREASATLLADLLAIDEGIELTIQQTNPGLNEQRAELDLADASTGDAHLYFADGGDGDHDADLGDGPTAGAFYLVLDTSGDVFTDALEPGDEFEIEWGLAGDAEERFLFDRSESDPPEPFAAESTNDDQLGQQYPYFSYEEAGFTTTTSFRIREERLTYEQTTADDDLLVANVADATIAGNTTLHPSTALSVELISDAGPTPSVTTSDVPIEADGSFAIDADFSAVEPGQRVTFELYDRRGLYDSRSVVVVTDPDAPFSFAIENTTPAITVTEGDSLANLTATVRNEGDIRGVGQLSLEVDGRLVDDQRVRAWPDEADHYDFGDTTAEFAPGEYEYTLSVGKAETHGSLIVEPSGDQDGEEDTDATDAVAADTGTDSDAGDGEDRDSDSVDDDDGADGEEEADGTDGGEPVDEDDGDEEQTGLLLPFGIGAREAFGSSVLVGATYVLGHWI